MLHLFQPRAEPYVRRFLEDNAHRVTLLAPPAVLEELARIDAGCDPRPVPVDGVPLTAEGLAALAARPADPDRCHVVYDPEGERPRLVALRESHPGLRFAGFVQDLLAALVARVGTNIFDLPKRPGMPRRIVLVFATPRSGSSLLADMLSDMGQGDVREHLREDIVKALASDYVYDRARTLQNFLCHAQRRGTFGTKIISHFFEDYIQSRPDFEVLRKQAEGIPVQVITLDRADKVGQAISAELASRRGVWHITDARSAEAIRNSAEVRYDFPRLFARYFSYQRQSAILDFVRRVFPDHLALEYGTDLDTGDPEALARRLATFLGIEGQDFTFRRAAARQKIADETNDQFRDRFVATFGRYFAGQP